MDPPDSRWSGMSAAVVEETVQEAEDVPHTRRRLRRPVIVEVEEETAPEPEGVPLPHRHPDLPPQRRPRPAQAVGEAMKTA